MSRILITGAAGLIGTALASCLLAAGHDVVGFDVAESGPGPRADVRDLRLLAKAVIGCSGVVHLGAVSRVVWGEQNPRRCRQVNVLGTRNVLAAVERSRTRRPWVLVASSREVYGQAAQFPVPESAPFRPLNAYGRSKVAAENMVRLARTRGVRAAVIRFSGVYGSAADHPDRVVPAFARRAAAGDTLYIDGSDTTLDFTHVDDVADGLRLAIESLATDRGTLPPPLHLVSGRATTLADLAQLAVRVAGGGSVQVRSARPYDVAKFVGDPTRAIRVLGWRARIPLEEGITSLVHAFRAGSISQSERRAQRLG